MVRLGITGGIGCGKSECARALASLGVRVIDTDNLARDVVAPGTDGLSEITREFGNDVLAADGTLDRSCLAAIVFADAAARTKLEAITHPRIRALWKGQLQSWANDGATCGAVVIPLLFETKAEKEFDFMVCVGCTEQSQLERLRARGWSDQGIQDRLAAQLDLDEKLARADFVVWAEGPVDRAREQITAILSQVQPRKSATTSPV